MLYAFAWSQQQSLFVIYFPLLYSHLIPSRLVENQALACDESVGTNEG